MQESGRRKHRLACGRSLVGRVARRAIQARSLRCSFGQPAYWSPAQRRAARPAAGRARYRDPRHLPHGHAFDRVPGRVAPQTIPPTNRLETLLITTKHSIAVLTRLLANSSKSIFLASPFVVIACFVVLRAESLPIIAIPRDFTDCRRENAPSLRYDFPSRLASLARKVAS